MLSTACHAMILAQSFQQLNLFDARDLSETGVRSVVSLTK